MINRITKYPLFIHIVAYVWNLHDRRFFHTIYRDKVESLTIWCFNCHVCYHSLWVNILKCPLINFQFDLNSYFACYFVYLMGNLFFGFLLLFYWSFAHFWQMYNFDRILLSRNQPHLFNIRIS